MYFFEFVAQAYSEKRNASSANGGLTYDLSGHNSDALPLSYRVSWELKPFN